VTVPFCVLCRTHPVDPRWRPFCSERCKWLDLAKWMDGEYRIPDVPVKEPGDDETDER
jgi:endogenous inhibitor of DNA gyrase (YacG/DUF329 family)